MKKEKRWTLMRPEEVHVSIMIKDRLSSMSWNRARDRLDLRELDARPSKNIRSQL